MPRSSSLLAHTAAAALVASRTPMQWRQRLRRTTAAFVAT
jgi:hypothetical protein